MIYPKSVPVDEKQLQALTEAYKSAYKDIYSEIATATEFGATRRKQILLQIQGILEELGANTQDIVAEIIPTYYKMGADQAVKQLQNINAPIDIKTGFNKIHKEAIDALINDTSTSLGDSITGVFRSAKALMSDATKQVITQKLATGQISGEALQRIQKQLVGTLQEQGLDSFIDKGGASWTLDRYTEMLIRTKTVEARNTGLTNRLIENGYDLVQVSSHGADDVCGDWEGKILSLTGATTELDGEEVPTVDEAEGEGLFHPNCRHALNGFTPDLAKETMGWDAEEQDYTKGRID